MCMVEKPNYYSVIPASVRYDKDLSPLAKLLYSEITALSNKEGYCWASNRYFAELYGKSEIWISLTIKKLEQKGYVKSEVNKIDGNERKIKIVDPPIYVKLKTSLSKVKDPSLSKVKDNNININIKNNNSAATSTAEAFVKKNESKKDDETPMTLSEFVGWCRGSTQRHVQIIGEYADEKKLNFTTKGQWQALIKRNVRAARQLEPYSDKQLSEAMERIDRDKADFLKRWTLETLVKYLE